MREITLEVPRESNSLLPALRLSIDFKKHLRPSAFWFHYWFSQSVSNRQVQKSSTFRQLVKQNARRFYKALRRVVPYVQALGSGRGKLLTNRGCAQKRGAT